MKTRASVTTSCTRTRASRRNGAAWLALALAFVLACQPATPDSHLSSTISPDAFLSSPPANALLLDVRSPAEYASGHIKGALNIPHDALNDRLAELGGQLEQPVVVYCEKGGRASVAEALLREAGFANVVHLEGDMSGWRSSGREVAQP